MYNLKNGNFLQAVPRKYPVASEGCVLRMQLNAFKKMNGQTHLQKHRNNFGFKKLAGDFLKWKVVITLT